MGILFIDDAAKAAIKAALERARADCVPWSVLQHLAHGDPSPVLTHDQRGPLKPPTKERLMLGSYEVALSFEEQPAGICKHLSVSASRDGRVPTELVMTTICQEFGFTKFPPELGRVWVEEYRPGAWAVNVIEVTEPASDKGTRQ